MPAMNRCTAAQRPISGCIIVSGCLTWGWKEMRLTDAKTGAKLSNFQSFGKDDLIIADRAYRTIAEWNIFWEYLGVAKHERELSPDQEGSIYPAV
jgi:hypothetical protein